MESQNTLSCECSYIIETLKRIDKMQKDAVVSEEQECITCQNSLISFSNNTIPLIIGLRCGGILTGSVGVTSQTASHFKVESIRCNRYITLRLLTIDDGSLSATPYTLTIDGECICYIQCLEPISTTSCNLNTL